jgi:gamma-glutamyltranspeptidase/glutathione hydrolase
VTVAQFERVGLRKRSCRSRGGAIVTKHPIATAVGKRVLEEGGNALDAAIAASFALAVVEPPLSGIGGVGLGLVWRQGEMTVLDGGPVAPARLDPERFRLAPEGADRDLFGWPAVEGNANLIGAASACVPTMPALMGALYERGASLPWSRLVQPAIELARDGFSPDWYLTLNIANDQEPLSAFASTAAVFLPRGRVPAYDLDNLAGQRARNEPSSCGRELRQPDLAETLAAIAIEGPQVFYRGAMAERLAGFVREQGGFLDADDLAAYTVRVTSPLRLEFMGTTVWLPDGLNGGPSMAEILHMYGLLRPAGAAWGSAEELAAWIRAGRLAFEDRFAYLGHAGHGPDVWTREHAERRATEAPRFAPAGVASDSTTYLSVVDGRGDAVSLNLTLLSPWGSKLVVPGLGVLLNNGMMWFDPRPGGPNSIRPGARALANMAPLLATREDRAVLLLGAAGGRRIVAAVPQILANVLVHGMDMQDAIEAPRVDFSVVPCAVDSRLGSVIPEVERLTGMPLAERAGRLAAGGFASPVGLHRTDGVWTAGIDPMGVAEAACVDRYA